MVLTASSPLVETPMMTDEPLPIAAGATQVMVEFSMQLRPCVIREQLGEAIHMGYLGEAIH